MNHLLSLGDLDQDDFLALIDRACQFADTRAPVMHEARYRAVGLDFRKTSTRTRTSFAVAALQLGLHPILFGPGDLQTNTGESPEDTVAVFAGYLDALVLRTAADPGELQRMAALNRLPIINAMSADEHPTQALSDLAMLKRQFGRLTGLRLLYTGEGNNTAAALALGCSRIDGLRATFHFPPGYGLSSSLVTRAVALARQFGGHVELSYDPPGSRAKREKADVVYTTRWQTTGTTKTDHLWREKFAPFRVSADLMARYAADQRPLFMHDLPAVRGEDCDAEVLEGADSIAVVQAHQKLFTAMAVLEWSIRGSARR